jgi:hypothetical protein
MLAPFNQDGLLPEGIHDCTLEELHSRFGGFQTMIETPEQLYQAIEQMGRMQRILESHRDEILTKNPRNFAMFAEGPLEQIRQLQGQIDEYVRRLEETPA